MKKFLFRFLLFFIPLVLFYVFMSSIAFKEIRIINDYLLAIIDKHARLDSIQSPRMIFAGGSNLAFGLNSAEIQKEFNIPVVNLGLHGGFGLLFMLNELKHTVRSGDVVFLSIEYFLKMEGNYRIRKFTGNHYKEAQKYYDNEIIENIDMHIFYTRKGMKVYFGEHSEARETQENEINIYAREGFNEYGDLVSHIGKQPPPTREVEHYVYEYWKGIEELNEFNEFAKAQNVKVFFLFPCLAMQSYSKNEAAIRRLAHDLSRDLNMKILSTPLDFVYDDDCFFDTDYHLTEAGREQRTMKLIEIIKRADRQDPFIPNPVLISKVAPMGLKDYSNP